MKLLIVTLLIVLGSVVSVFAENDDGAHLWIPVEVKWQRIPGAPRSDQKRTASAVVLYFGKDGEFVQDECWLIRDGKSISISNGDPHNEYVGRIAEHILDGMRIDYRLVRRTVERKGEVLPGPKISEDASVRAISGLAMGTPRRFFHRVILANESDYVEIYSNLAKQYAQK